MMTKLDVIGLGTNAIDQVIQLYRLPDANTKVVCPSQNYRLFDGGVMGNTLTGLSEKTVLHLGTGMDRFAGDALIKVGCRNVTDYDPNFCPDPSVLDRQYDIVMAHYVVNILPPEDRRQVYRLIAKTLRNGPRCSGCPAPQLTFRSLRHKNLKTAQPDNLKTI